MDKAASISRTQTVVEAVVGQRSGKRVSLWLPKDAYAVLSELAKNWGESRTAVLIRLINMSKKAKLRLECEFTCVDGDLA